MVRASIPKFQLAAAALLIASAAARGQEFTISTVAGAPLLGTTPVAATTVGIGFPEGVTTDAAGNVFFTSFVYVMGVPGQAYGAIFKLDPNGILTRFAGARGGYSGDVGPALATGLGLATDLAFDGAGNLYFADGINGDGADSRIRKISFDGIITTVATHMPMLFRLAVDTAGNLYFAEGSNRSWVRKISPDGVITNVAGNGTYGISGDGGPATSAQIGVPDGLAVDGAGNLYLSDNYQDDSIGVERHRVRKISPDGIITTVAGNGGSGYSGDDGPAPEAQLMSPGHLAVDKAGNLYIEDGPRVRKVSADGIITTVAGNGSRGYSGDGGPAVNAQLAEIPYASLALAVDGAGSLYIANSYRIRKVSAKGIITTVAGNGDRSIPLGDGVPATQAQLINPVGVAVDSAGTLYISDTFTNRVLKVSADGLITTVAGRKEGANGLEPLEAPPDRVPASASYLYWPAGMATDRGGNLYIADSRYARIRRVSPTGTITTVAGSASLRDRHGYSGDGGPATSALLSWPKDVALDGAGNVYIADSGNSRVRMVSQAGIITTVAGSGDAGLKRLLP